MDEVTVKKGIKKVEGKYCEEKRIVKSIGDLEETCKEVRFCKVKPIEDDFYEVTIRKNWPCENWLSSRNTKTKNETKRDLVYIWIALVLGGMIIGFSLGIANSIRTILESIYIDGEDFYFAMLIPTLIYAIGLGVALSILITNKHIRRFGEKYIPGSNNHN